MLTGGHALNQHAPADATWAKSAAAWEGTKHHMVPLPPSPNISRSQSAPAARAAAANKCSACINFITVRARHFSCEAPTCPRSCHRGNKFSMLSQYSRARTSWPCPGHTANKSSAPPPPTRPVSLPQSNCRSCNNIIRAGTCRLSCAEPACATNCHKI